MSNSVGKFKFILAVLIGSTFSNGVWAYAVSETSTAPDVPVEINMGWTRFESSVVHHERSDYLNGISYIISGTVAVVGGFVGQSISQDPLEKGVYTVFQTIGIASIGYGAYTWKLGDDDRFLYETLKDSSLGIEERNSVLKSYYQQKKSREKSERAIKAVTHGLIAALNLYSATQQSKGPVQNALFFVGGVNLLAAVSFSF